MNSNEDIETFLKKLYTNCKIIQKKSFRKNQTITTYIQKRNQICILLNGEADLVKYDSNGEKYIIEHFTKSDIFGEAFYTVATNNELYVEAKKSSEVLFFNYDNVYHRCNYNCKFHQILSDNFSKLILNKIMDLNTRVEILTKRSIREKLRAYFNILSSMNMSKTFTLPFSLTDLSDFLSVDRSAMMRELSSLKKEGFIEKNGNKITLLYK